MKRKNKIGLILTVAAILTGAAACKDDIIKIDSLEKEIFLRETREGIYRNGAPLFLYSERYHQKAHNQDRLQFRMQTDEQDTCLNIILDAIPRNAGVHITTSIDYRSPGELISSMSHLECSRADDDKLWLWSSGNLTGIILDIKDLN